MHNVASRAAWRPEVVRRSPAPDGGEAGLTELTTELAPEADPAETARRHARGQTWASLMARSFDHHINCSPPQRCDEARPDHASVPSARRAGNRRRDAAAQLG